MSRLPAVGRRRSTRIQKFATPRRGSALSCGLLWEDRLALGGGGWDRTLQYIDDRFDSPSRVAGRGLATPHVPVHPFHPRTHFHQLPSGLCKIDMAWSTSKANHNRHGQIRNPPRTLSGLNASRLVRPTTKPWKNPYLLGSAVLAAVMGRFAFVLYMNYLMGAFH